MGRRICAVQGGMVGGKPLLGGSRCPSAMSRYCIVRSTLRAGHTATPRQG